MVENKPIVVITGVSGYLGSRVCYDFLLDGSFTVRGTVRDKNSDNKINPLKEAFGAYFSKLELINVDLLDSESISNAIKGADYVVHTASPFTYSSKTEEDLVRPAV